MCWAPVVSAQHNTNLGYKAGDATTPNQSNVMVGSRAGETNTGTGNIFIGSQAGQNEAGSNKLIISNHVTNSTIYGELDNKRIAIATDEFPTDTAYKLAVEGKVIAREFRATQAPGWPDYVFDPSYALMDLQTLEQYIQTHKHLPDIPTAIEVANEGIELAAMNTLLLKKVEELTLYIIAQQKSLYNQDAEISSLEISIEELKKMIAPSGLMSQEPNHKN